MEHALTVAISPAPSNYLTWAFGERKNSWGGAGRESFCFLIQSMIPVATGMCQGAPLTLVFPVTKNTPPPPPKKANTWFYKKSPPPLKKAKPWFSPVFPFPVTKSPPPPKKNKNVVCPCVSLPVTKNPPPPLPSPLAHLTPPKAPNSRPSCRKPSVERRTARPDAVDPSGVSESQSPLGVLWS